MTAGEIPTLADEEVRRRLASELPAWSYDGAWLRREVPTGSWGRSLRLAGGLAYLAEAARHHPDLEVSEDRVEIQLRHHWAAGITESDLELARALEEALRGAGFGGDSGDGRGDRSVSDAHGR